MTTPNISNTKTPTPLSQDATMTPVGATREDPEDPKIDLMAEINEVIQLAVGKKGYRKRLERVEKKIKSYQLMEVELEILKKRQELLDFADVRTQLQDLSTSHEESITTLTMTITKALKEEILPTLKTELIQDLNTTITNEINNQITKLVPANSDITDFPPLQQSYASKAAKLPPPKPALVISPKDLNFPVHKLRNELNNCNSAAALITNCYATRGGKLIVQCMDETAKEKVHQEIVKNEHLSTVANVTESRPKNTRLMIFGAPLSPIPTTRFKQGEELPTDFREYLDNFLTPSLQKALHKDLADLTYKIILNLQAPK